jgi:hypothetical protein
MSTARPNKRLQLALHASHGLPLRRGDTGAVDVAGHQLEPSYQLRRSFFTAQLKR